MLQVRCPSWGSHLHPSPASESSAKVWSGTRSQVRSWGSRWPGSRHRACPPVLCLYLKLELQVACEFFRGLRVTLGKKGTSLCCTLRQWRLPGPSRSVLPPLHPAHRLSHLFLGLLVFGGSLHSVPCRPACPVLAARFPSFYKPSAVSPNHPDLWPQHLLPEPNKGLFAGAFSAA